MLCVSLARQYRLQLSQVSKAAGAPIQINYEGTKGRKLKLKANSTKGSQGGQQLWSPLYHGGYR